MGGGGGGAGVEEQPSRLREEKVGISPLTSPDLSQKKKAVREEGGEGDKEEDSGVQLPAGRGEPLLVHLGDVGNVQVTRKLLETQLEGQEWWQRQA